MSRLYTDPDSMPDNLWCAFKAAHFATELKMKPGSLWNVGISRSMVQALRRGESRIDVERRFRVQLGIKS